MPPGPRPCQAVADALLESAPWDGEEDPITTINQELYEALKEAGASEDAAKRAAASVYDKDRLATKTGLAEMRTAIEARLARLGSDIAWIKWIVTGGVGLYVLRSIVEWLR